VQIQKLAGLGKRVVVAFDNDPAGVENAVKVRARLLAHGAEAEIRHPPKAFKDVGEMTAKEVATWAAA
jgi:DNA primase